MVWGISGNPDLIQLREKFLGLSSKLANRVYNNQVSSM